MSLLRYGAIEIKADEGSNNRVSGGLPEGSGATLRFEALFDSGSDNAVEFGQRVKLSDLTIVFRGTRCRVLIGNDVRLAGRIMISGNGSVVSIGDKTTAERVGIVASEGHDVIIGQRCMISYQVELRNSDAHSILDAATGKRINRPEHVHIGDHVWLGAHSLICKGVAIPSDVIVGQGSIVTKSIEQTHCVVAGNPARIVRTGTTWDNRLLPFDV